VRLVLLFYACMYQSPRTPSPAINAASTSFLLHPELFHKVSTRDTSSFWCFSPHYSAIAKNFADRLPPARLLAHTHYVQALPSPTLAEHNIILKPFLPIIEKPLQSRYRLLFISQVPYRISRVPNTIVFPAATPSRTEAHCRISPIPKVIETPDAINYLILKLSPTRLAQTNQIAMRPPSALQEPVFNPVPFPCSRPFSPSSTSKSLTLLPMFISSPKQTHTFPANYATFHWLQLIVIATPTIINLPLIISSSPSSIVAPVMLMYSRPTYFQSHFPLVAVDCPFLHHRHHKPSSRHILKSQLDHRTNSHFSCHFPTVAAYSFILPPLSIY
jgi:hypothetical protein